MTLAPTKGIDEPLADRPDLRSYLEDPRVIPVLCSAFTSALDASVVQLLNTAGETGTWPSAAQRTTILVLPKNDEALQVKHDSGELPESFDEGYEIKADKVRDTLRRIGRVGLPVVMYNSETDASDGLASVLLQRVEGVRAAHVKRIEETVRAIDGLAAEAYRAGVAQVHAAFYDQLRGSARRNFAHRQCAHLRS